MMLSARDVITAVVVLGGILSASGSNGAAQGDAGDASLPPIWTGVYTAAQAEEGKVPFTGVCRRCHSDNLEGSERGPALKGASFMSNWEQQDLDRLRSKIRDNMPPDDPGKLSDADYLGLVSYILQNNGYPAGAKPLEASALSGIQLMPKPGTPSVLRSFSVVQVVGCLSQSANHSWVLTGANDPLLARDRVSSPEELRALDALPAGAQTFELVSVSAYAPETHAGRKVEVKGLLYKSPDKNRVNVSALQPVGGGCAR
jgi:mono/diheme cytochrome c family protein